MEFCERDSTICFLYWVLSSFDNIVYAPPLMCSYLLLDGFSSLASCSCCFMDILSLASHNYLVSRTFPYWHQWKSRSTRSNQAIPNSLAHFVSRKFLLWFPKGNHQYIQNHIRSERSIWSFPLDHTSHRCDGVAPFWDTNSSVSDAKCGKICVPILVEVLHPMP